MKKWFSRLALLVLVLCGTLEADAQYNSPNYTFLVTSVTSSSTPVQIMTNALRASFACKTLSSASGPVDVWSYTGSLPGAKATNYTVINAGDSIGDTVTNGQGGNPGGLLNLNAVPSTAWAAVLDSGSSAVTVFCWWR